MNRFVLPVVLVVVAGLLVAYLVWLLPVFRLAAGIGLILLAVLVLVDTVLERRRI